MRRVVTACVLAVCCAAPFAGPASQRGRADESVSSEPNAARLVRELGSADFKAREAATRRLLEYEAPPPALRAAVKSGDPEVARRASRIIHEITRREENAAFAQLTEFVQNGEIDRLAELLARRLKWHDEVACWQAVAELNGKLLDLEKKQFRFRGAPGRRGFFIEMPTHLCPRAPDRGGPFIGDFRRYAQWLRPQMVAARRADLDLKGPGHFVVRAEHIAAKGVEHGLLVSSRGTRVHSVHDSVILAGGPVEVELMSGPILVCAGDVKCCDVFGCLLIARGDVRISGYARDCVIITAGSVQFLPNKVLDGKIPRHENVEIKEHEPNPLGFVKWFDPARVGVTVEAAAGGVRVKAAAKSFAAAGLRAGDLLTAIDGEAVKTTDEFRLLLRTKLADGGKMVLTVRRAGQDLKIPVRCKD
jgi:hypothetical protein